MRVQRRSQAGRPQGGFTFLGLMFIIVLMGLMAAAAGATWSFVTQRDEEEHLLFVGREYAQAIGRYADAHKGDAHPYPIDLAQLLQDGRQLTPQRYLRRLYFDPLTGRAEWGLVKDKDGGIVGLYSLSLRKPIRRAWTGPATGIAFDTAKTYQDWVFRPVLPATAAPAIAGATGASASASQGDDEGAPPLWAQHPAPTPPPAPDEHPN